jgi:hypothetical protein
VGSQHNNQLTVCHEGGDVLAVQCPAVDESPTRQSHRNVVANSLLHLELSNMRKLVVVVSFVNKYLVCDDLGSHPNLLTNVKRTLGKGFLDMHDEIFDVLWALLILK